MKYINSSAYFAEEMQWGVKTITKNIVVNVRIHREVMIEVQVKLLASLVLQ